MRHLIVTMSHRDHSSYDLTGLVVKFLLSISTHIKHLADAHDARERFAHLDAHQLADIGLTASDRDFRLIG